MWTGNDRQIGMVKAPNIILRKKLTRGCHDCITGYTDGGIHTILHTNDKIWTEHDRFIGLVPAPNIIPRKKLIRGCHDCITGYTDGGIHTILHTSDKRTFIRGISSKLHICGLDMIDKSAWSRLPSPYRGRNLLDDATIAVVGYTDGGIHTIHHTNDKRTFIQRSLSKFRICGLEMIDKSAWSKLPTSY